MFLAWTDSLSVGVDEIDEDHRHLIAMAQESLATLQRGATPEEIALCLVHLADYAGGHFQREEDVMRRIGYPRLEEHRKQHDELVQGLSKLVFEFERDQDSLSVDTLTFVQTWILNHLMEHDKAIGDWLRVQGGDGSGQPAKGQEPGESAPASGGLGMVREAKPPEHCVLMA